MPNRNPSPAAYLRASLLVLSLPLIVPAVLSAQAPAAPAAEPKWYERVHFEGDFRPRFDMTYQDQGAGKENEDLRDRFRFRLRFGVTSPVGKNFSVGFRLASNEGKNPTSGNVTFGQGTAPKTIVLDRAYFTWTPGSVFSATAGKFANTIEKPAAVVRSELVWDEDLAPEGLTETITLKKASKGVVRRLAVNLQQWYLLEFSSAIDSWMLGGQAVLDLQPGARTALTLTGGYYDYLNGQVLAQAANSNDLIIVTNSVVLKDGTVVEGGKLLKPSASNPFDRYLNDFSLVHGSASLHVNRVLGEAGLQLYGEVVDNTKAEDYGFGMQAGLGLDRLRKLPGWSLSATYVRIEQEAALSMFSYSDLGRGGTNQQGVILQAQYRPVRNVTLTARDHIVSPIRTVSPDTPTNRLQIDITLAF